jgi:hypothetical protein
MTVMLQSSKAQDRTLGLWFQQIQQGMVKLPRFQRFESWDPERIRSFLNTIIDNLPVGVTLALEVAGEEKFDSRYIVTATPMTPGTVNQHLLDGQQRLTAFWRAMHNNYEWDTYFVYLPQLESKAGSSDKESGVRSVPRWINKNKLLMPRWVEEPIKCLERGLIPISLLRPEDISDEIDDWLLKATNHLKPSPADPDAYQKLESFNETKTRIKKELTTLRERVKFFNLPYLSLPADTSKDVALQVFINMNTNSKPLSMYDIIVAEVEDIAGQSLHSLVAKLNEKHPAISRYGDISGLVLSTSALLQDKLPNARGMVEMDKKALLDNWPKLERGLDRMAAFLEGQHVFDEARLPTNAVLAVIAAAYSLIPDNGDFLGKAEKLLRRYIWSSFFNDRYENSAASRAYVDFRAIKDLLGNPQFSEGMLNSVPALNRVEFPLATVDSLLTAGWPKKAGIKARAVLGVTMYLGAIDFADHRPASYLSIQQREYHHIFPDALLSEAKIGSFLALNCALITWKTNRIIGRKDPLEYLNDRVELADEVTVRDRLKTHLISFDALSKAHYENLNGEELEKRLNIDFIHFLRERAELVVAAMTLLADGNSPSLESLWKGGGG